MRADSSRCRLLVSLAVLASCWSSTAAQTVRVVPDAFPTIQAAVDAAAAGDVVLVRGGTHEPFRVDKALTLIGKPRPRVVPFTESEAGNVPAVELAGPGSGKVALVNFEVGGTINGLEFYLSRPGISGGGFDELELQDCEIAGPTWQQLTGIAIGSPALATSVPALVISRSVLRGARSDNDGCYGNYPPGADAIQAPSSTVVLLDSRVTGGGSGSMCGFGSCPTGGAGGTGIVAAALYEAGSVVEGGAGGLGFPDGSYSESCGAAADGAALDVATHVVLAGQLSAQGAPELGAEWTLAWSTADSSSTLFLGRALRVPPLVSGSALVFVDDVFLVRNFASGSAALSYAVPYDAALLGQRLVAQVSTPVAGLTRPLVQVVQPGRGLGQRHR